MRLSFFANCSNISNVLSVEPSSCTSRHQSAKVWLCNERTWVAMYSAPLYVASNISILLIYYVFIFVFTLFYTCSFFLLPNKNGNMAKKMYCIVADILVKMNSPINSISTNVRKMA